MSSIITCRKCRKGRLLPTEKVESYHPPKLAVVEVRLLASRCDLCSAETVLPSQQEANIEKRRERKAGYGEHLIGEEIFAFRRKYGLSQQDFSKVFGLGKIAFSRYENEKSFPEESTRKLIQMAMYFPDVLKRLADDSGVEIPLWGARLEQSRAQKVRAFRVIGGGEQALDFANSGDDSMSPRVLATA
jgi:putative zinc finger/helix-turn-helix YgiT family protein